MKSAIVGLLTLVAVSLGACLAVPVKPQPDLRMDVEGPRWFVPDSPPVAVAVVLHGLNNRPSIMDSLADHLRSRNVLVYRAVLPGHGALVEGFHLVTRESWLAAVQAALELGRVRAATQNLPLWVLGYSLGALLDYRLEAQGQPWATKAVYLAPALVPRPGMGLVRLFSWDTGAALVSQSPQAYRGAAATPFAAYNALFACVEDLPALGRLDRPTLVLGDPADEMVDSALAVSQFGTSQWRFVPVDARDGVVGGGHRHLIVDGRVMQGENWRRLLSAIDEFLF